MSNITRPYKPKQCFEDENKQPGLIIVLSYAYQQSLHLQYQLQLTNQNMKIVIPKGAYHNYCRNTQTSKSLPHATQMRSVRNHRIQKEIQEIQHFRDFETYLLYIQDRNTHRNVANSSRNSSTAREVKTSRPKTQQVVNRSIDKYKQSEQPIKPFFPFFKCKIESCAVPSRQSNFRINNRKFKLNYRIIEQNMGKGEQKFYL